MSILLLRIVLRMFCEVSYRSGSCTISLLFQPLSKISDERRTLKQAHINIDYLPQRCETDASQYLQEKLCNAASLGQIFLDISGKVSNFFAHTFLDLCVQEHPGRKKFKPGN